MSLKQTILGILCISSHCITDEDEDRLPAWSDQLIVQDSIVTTCKRCGTLVRCSPDKDKEYYFIEEVEEL